MKWQCAVTKTYSELLRRLCKQNFSIFSNHYLFTRGRIKSVVIVTVSQTKVMTKRVSNRKRRKRKEPTNTIPTMPLLLIAR